MTISRCPTCFKSTLATIVWPKMSNARPMSIALLKFLFKLINQTTSGERLINFHTLGSRVIDMIIWFMESALTGVVSCLRRLTRRRRKNFIQKFIQENFNEPFIDPFAFDHAIEDSVEFGDIVNQCINYDLTRSYGLKAHTMVQYCKINGRTKDIGNSLDLRYVYGFDSFVSFQTMFISFLL